jgi:hypothetical protein
VCEIFSLALKEGNGLKVLESRVMRRISGEGKKQETRELCVTRCYTLPTPCQILLEL